MQSCLLMLVLPLLAAQEKPALELVKFAPEGGGFTVMLPGKPTEQTRKDKGPDGKEVTIHLYVLEQKPTAYVIARTIEPSLAEAKPDDVSARLEKIRKALESRLNGKVESEKRITLDKHPGAEIQLRLEGDRIYRSRIYFVKEKLYQVTVLGPKDVTQSEDSTKILDSFQLLK